MGYHRAGFEVVGIDIKPQPHYPFEFHQGDALTYPLDGFDVIHASPPCQKYSVTRHLPWVGDHPDLVGRTRERLSSMPCYIIENVYGAPLENPLMLCGLMFGLKVLRHRFFECKPWMMGPGHPLHPAGELTGSHRNHPGYRKAYPFVTVAGHNFDVKRAREAMGIDWMTRDELSQAIPPAYTEWIGKQLLKMLREQRGEER